MLNTWGSVDMIIVGLGCVVTVCDQWVVDIYFNSST